VGESIITPTNALSVDFPRNHKQLATARLASVTHIEPILLGRKDEVVKTRARPGTVRQPIPHLAHLRSRRSGLHQRMVSRRARRLYRPCTSETQTSQYSVNANDSTTTNAQSKISESTFSTEQPKLNTASPLTGSAGCSSANQKTNAKTSKCSNTTHSEAPSLRLSFQSTPSSHNSKLNECSGTPLSGKQPTLRTSSTGNSIENPSTNPSRYSKQILTQ